MIDRSDDKRSMETEAAVSGWVPRCVQCGYIILHLSENRCPECGRGFDSSELDYPPRPKVRLRLRNGFTSLLNGILPGNENRNAWLSLDAPKFALGLILISAACSQIITMLGSMFIYPVGIRRDFQDALALAPGRLAFECAGLSIAYAFQWASTLGVLRAFGVNERLASEGSSRIVYVSWLLQPIIEACSAPIVPYGGRTWGAWYMYLGLIAFAVTSFLKVACIVRCAGREPGVGVSARLVLAVLCPESLIWLLFIFLEATN